MRQIRTFFLHRLGRLNLGVVAALATAVLAATVYFAEGSRVFSPGDLKLEPRVNVPRGDVKAHAELTGNCAACHASPWSGDRMADRCLHCHTNVREQLDAGRPLHGRLDDAADCRGCHTEHNGPTAVLTSMAKFNHDLTAYPLTGAHCKVDCAKCHVTAGFQGVPKTCLGCHAEPPIHQRRLGTDCETCHNTQTWDGALFDHSFFSVSHHQRRQANTCATCHKDPTNYTICSCSGTGCHSRTTPRIAQMLKPRVLRKN